jgi:tetratricopeptide (TPR) repeat protein
MFFVFRFITFSCVCCKYRRVRIQAYKNKNYLKKIDKYDKTFIRFDKVQRGYYVTILLILFYYYYLTTTAITVEEKGVFSKENMRQEPFIGVSSNMRVSPNEDVTADISQAIADLQRLEQLHSKADQMKNVGNKYMANEKFEEALRAYSEAILLSPTGPQSHIFYSNRAAASLSLKRYTEAVDDARRSIALQPTFGKAHARLGQALYFERDYEGAVQAYEEALQYEDTADSAVTWTYLAKAKAKLEKIQAARNDQSPTSVTAATDNTNNNNNNNNMAPIAHFYRKGSIHLTMKEYTLALHDFNTAIRLMDDEVVDLTSSMTLAYYRLYYNRALTHFYLKDYEEACSDARHAIQLTPDSYEAFSVLGRSLFFLQDYEGAITAITEGLSTIPLQDEQQHTQSVSFDKAYLAKAKQELAAIIAETQEPEKEPMQPQHSTTPSYSSSPDRDASTISSTPYYSPSRIPKLKPPRFVPREEAMVSTPNIPSMPKSWPCQTVVGDNTILVATERTVIFYDGVMGIKLNRGSDGFVRILSTNILPPDDPQLARREGTISSGDVLREVAGVDLRRPITNPMWGDTVALIKISKRPVTFIVAKELSSPPLGVQEELSKAQLEEMERQMLQRPHILKKSPDRR